MLLRKAAVSGSRRAGRWGGRVRDGGARCRRSPFSGCGEGGLAAVELEEVVGGGVRRDQDLDPASDDRVQTDNSWIAMTQDGSSVVV